MPCPLRMYIMVDSLEYDVLSVLGYVPNETERKCKAVWSVGCQDISKAIASQ